MANVIGPDVWIVDTPGAAVLFSGWIRVKEVFWNNPAAGNAFVIQDKNGKTMLASTFATGQQPLFSPDGWWDGLVVPTLTGGSLQIQTG